MEVLKGIFLAIWSIVGLVVMIMLVGLMVFLMGGGPQKLMSSFNPAQLLGGKVNGTGPGQGQPLGGGADQYGQQPGSDKQFNTASGQPEQPGTDLQGQSPMPGSSAGAGVQTR